jgi:hypothetical protein
MGRRLGVWRLGLGTLVGVAACGDDGTRASVADASARVAIAAATITGQDAILANEVVRTS